MQNNNNDDNQQQPTVPEEIPMRFFFSQDRYVASTDDKKLGYLTLPMLSKAPLGMGRNCYYYSMIAEVKVPVLIIQHQLLKKTLTIQFSTVEELGIFIDSVNKYLVYQLGLTMRVNQLPSLAKHVSAKKIEYMKLVISNYAHSALFHKVADRKAKKALAEGRQSLYDPKAMEQQAKNTVLSDYQ